MLQDSLNKFVQKIDLIQSKQLQSIKKFEITDDMVESIMQGYRNQCAQFEGMDYLSDWKKKNQSNAAMCDNIFKIMMDEKNMKDILK